MRAAPDALRPRAAFLLNFHPHFDVGRESSALLHEDEQAVRDAEKYGGGRLPGPRQHDRLMVEVCPAMAQGNLGISTLRLRSRHNQKGGQNAPR